MISRPWRRFPQPEAGPLADGPGPTLEHIRWFFPAAASWDWRRHDWVDGGSGRVHFPQHQLLDLRHETAGAPKDAKSGILR